MREAESAGLRRTNREVGLVTESTRPQHKTVGCFRLAIF
jgi:hypothetical protein